MGMFAANHGIALAGIEFEVKKEMSASPRKIARIEVAFRLRGDFSDLDFKKLVAAGKACPVRLTLDGNVEIVDSYERA